MPVADWLGGSCRKAFEQTLFNGSPGLAVGPHAQTGESHIFSERQVRFTVADHVGIVLIEYPALEILLDETGIRFPAGAAFAGHVRTDEHFVKMRPLTLKDLHHQLMRALEGFSGK